MSKLIVDLGQKGREIGEIGRFAVIIQRKQIFKRLEEEEPSSLSDLSYYYLYRIVIEERYT